MLSKWINFDHKDTIYKLKFGRFKLGNSPNLPNFPVAKLSRYTVYCTEKTK